LGLYARLSDEVDQGRLAQLVCAELYGELLRVLGFQRVGLVHTDAGPLSRVGTVGMTEEGPLVIAQARPVDDVTELLARNGRTLFEPFEVSEDESTESVARALTHVFNQADAPEFALVFSGPLLLITQRTRWAEGRYLVVNLQLVAERNDTKRGGEIDRVLTCVAAESLVPGADGTLWWADVLEESVSHTVGVSDDLRDGVRESIEILAGEVVARRRAQGLAPLPQDQAQTLAVQSLRFLYRILFLLYAEASPELGVLPAGDPVYEQGYSLDRLRELALVELSDPRAQHSTHLYDSLAVLFRMVDEGNASGVVFNPLKADLFTKQATSFIDEVGLGDGALQQVLERLLVSRKGAGVERGFISYAELGINQMGAVYEGLMSYTGFFAEEDLYEVAPGGDASKGSWVVPTDRAEGIAEKDFVTTVDPVTGVAQPVVHRTGSFVFRLAGRDRQQSASYYTPEVLTQFTVGQALEELLDQDGQTTPAREILNLKVCEPALGSGAFAIEAVRQLAEEYLRRRELELGEQVDPEVRPQEIQKIKAYLALHNVYGVDLNAT
ncbi:MAG TPA: class I SAM-dependent DNA methyltransferase, partial [Beutenbergiaceae bacterium]|nr:class I SAM-dependent DNA methyltransferase [Beutenbergiaceae bacterium]